MAVVLALAAAVGWGSSDYAAGRSSRTSSAISIVVLLHLASVIALVVFATMPGQTGSPDVADLLWGLAAGLGGAVGTMLLFNGLVKGAMSVVVPTTALGAITIPVITGLAQGESLGLLGGLGVAVALCAMVLVSLDRAAEATADPAVDAGTDAPDPSGSDDAADSDASADAGEDEVGSISGLMHQPDAGRSDASDDALIEAYEREFELPSHDDEHALAEVATEQLESPEPAPDPIEVARSFNELAAAVHHRRDEFETVRLSQMRPVVDRPIPDDFFGKSDARRRRRKARPPKERRADRPVKSAARTASPTRPPGPGPGPRPAPRPRPGASVSALLRRPGVLDALFAGIGFGVFFVLIARASDTAGHWPLVSARFVSVVMFAAGAIIATRSVLPDRASRPAVVLAGLLDAAAAVLFVASTHEGVLSVGAALAAMYPVATVLLARFVGHERITRRRGSGLVLAGLAVALLAV